MTRWHHQNVAFFFGDCSLEIVSPVVVCFIYIYIFSFSFLFRVWKVTWINKRIYTAPEPATNRYHTQERRRNKETQGERNKCREERRSARGQSMDAARTKGTADSHLAGKRKISKLSRRIETCRQVSLKK